MCEVNIQQMLNKFIDGKNVTLTNLTYKYKNGNDIWCDRAFFDQKGWNSPEHSDGQQTWHNVDAEFNNFCTGFNNSPKDTINNINNIFVWGFGQGFVTKNGKLSKSYADRIIKFNSDNDKVVFNSEKDFLRKSISSWSKVLAAYTFNGPEQNKYFIYDSRVAIALNIIDPDYTWFLPNENGHGVVFALIKKYRNGVKTSAVDSYRRYCDSLRKKGGVTLERQLFMLVDFLDFKLPEGVNWRNCIFVNDQKKKTDNSTEITILGFRSFPRPSVWRCAFFVLDRLANGWKRRKLSRTPRRFHTPSGCVKLSKTPFPPFGAAGRQSAVPLFASAFPHAHFSRFFVFFRPKRFVFADFLLLWEYAPPKKTIHFT